MTDSDKGAERTHRSGIYKLADDTRVVCVVAGVGLLMVAWTFFGPGKHMLGSSLGKVASAAVLLYAAYSCAASTHRFAVATPGIMRSPDLGPERTNAAVSYGFSFLILLLAVYVLKKTFW